MEERKRQPRCSAASGVQFDAQREFKGKIFSALKIKEQYQTCMGQKTVVTEMDCSRLRKSESGKSSSFCCATCMDVLI